ncbi:MAG: hypothetical protein KatS3mg077_1751 [Candidatus Binatia bacterium]|nr:MAG: hypothetical protein KatS3mg077_1751 [Candidatus Binatia bacterium]
MCPTSRHPIRQRISLGRFVTGLAACVFVFLACWRDRQAEFQPRTIWGELSPLFEKLREWGYGLTLAALDRSDLVILIGCATGAILAAIALLLGGRRALVLWLWLLAALGVAGGQWALLQERWSVGLAGYAVGFVLAAFYGWRIRSHQPAPPPPPTSNDYALALWVAILCTFSRLWALLELPARFEGEMGISMLAGTSWPSLKAYLVESISAVSIGCAHLFVELASFVAFGDSVFSLRATSVVFGIATVWNLFWLLRQHVGREAAWWGSVLAICAAEQLWWSRSENSYFIAVCFAGVVTSRLTAWLVADPRWYKALLVAVWMGTTRLFYLASVTLFLLPLFAMAHALLVERQRRHQRVVALGILAIGVGLWATSLSLVHVAVRGEWRWIHPAAHAEISGDAQPPLGERIRFIAQRLADNVVAVAKQWTVVSGFTQWYQRHTWPHPPTIINIGMVAAGVVGLGVALGQWRSWFPSMLVGWFVLGSLPALMSIEPADRRMAAAFPAYYALASYGWQHVIDWVRTGQRPLVTWAWRLAGWGILGLVALSSLSTHLMLPKREVSLAALGRATRDIFRSSEAIYYEMDPAALPLVVMVHSSQWRSRLPCTDPLAPSSWLSTIIERPCSFGDIVWNLMIDKDARWHRKVADSPPRQWTVFLAAVPDAERKRALLRRLFPNGRERHVAAIEWSYDLTLFTATQSDLEGLQSPEIVERPILEVQAGEQGFPACLTLVRASVFAPRDGWYAWKVEPPWQLLRWGLGVAAGTDNAGSPMPLTSGFHSFHLETRGPCGRLPTVLLRGEGQDEWRPATLWSGWLANDVLTKAAPYTSYPGYESAGRVIEDWGEIVDIGPSGPDSIVAAVWREGRYWLVEGSLSGGVLASHVLAIPATVRIEGFVPGPGGYYWVLTESGVVMTDREGNILHRWRPEAAPIRPQIVWWANGTQVLSAIPGSREIQLADVTGNVLGRIHTFQGGRGHFVEPTGIAFDPETGRFAVAEADGHVLLFRMRAEKPLDWILDAEISVPLSVRGAARVLTFASGSRLIVGDLEWPLLFFYDREGRRLLAADPDHDWAKQLTGVGVVRRIVSTDGSLLLVAGGRGALHFTEARSDDR